MTKDFGFLAGLALCIAATGAFCSPPSTRLCWAKAYKMADVGDEVTCSANATIETKEVDGETWIFCQCDDGDCDE